MNIKKYILFVSIIIVNLVFIYIFPIFLSGLIIAIEIIFLLINKKVKKYLSLESKDYLTNGKYYRDLRRNFDYMILGSSKVKQYYNPKFCDCNYLNYSFYERSLSVDFDILKNLHSLVKSEGTIIITIDYSNIMNRRTYITPLDKCVLHPILLRKYNILFLRFQIAFPLLFNPIFCFRYILKRKKPGNSITWDSSSSESLDNIAIDNSILSDIERTIEEMILFCNERNLNVKIVFINSDASSICANRLLIEKFKYKYKTLDIVVVNNNKEINLIFNNSYNIERLHNDER
ncbi:MAG: hypothetical protein ACOCRK_08195 [bacterium]